jgi:cellulose biosynthesis protein BcsQ
VNVIDDLNELSARLVSTQDARRLAMQQQLETMDIDGIKQNQSLSLSELSKSLMISSPTLRDYIAQCITSGELPDVMQQNNGRYMYTLDHCVMISDMLSQHDSPIKLGVKRWRDRGFKKHIIAVSSQKGGTGKTQTSACLSSGIASDVGSSIRTLVIDLDPQGSQRVFSAPTLSADDQILTAVDLMLGGKENNSLYEAAKQRFDHSDIVKASCLPTYNPNLKIIPAFPADERFNSFAWQNMTDGMDVVRLLKERVINPVIDDFDIIIIDLPPNNTPLVWSAYEAATTLLIPCATRELDWSSIKEFMIDLPNKLALLPSKGKQLDLYKVVATLYEDDKNSNLSSLADMKTLLGDRLLNTPIIKSTAFEAAAKNNRTPFEIRKKDRLCPAGQLEKAQFALKSFTREFLLVLMGIEGDKL